MAVWWFCQELSKSIRLAWPIVLSFTFMTTLSFVSLAFCGHIEDSPLIIEAVGLALSVVKISGISVAVGIVSTLDTLATQAWGAGNHKKVGIYLQRGIIILALSNCLVLSLWFNAETILNLLHQPPEVVKMAVQYIWIFSAALPAVCMYIILQTYLQSQNIVYPFIFTGLCANVVNALVHYLFLFVAKWGIRGAAGAVALTWYTLLFSLLIIIYVRKLHVKTWGGWSRECLKDWGQFARFSIFGLIMVIVEWISFEAGFFIAGFIGNIQQAIHSLLCTFMYVLFAVPKALSVTATIRVGNELGSGRPKGAKKAIFVILSLAFVWIIVIATLITSLKDYTPMIFTADVDVLQAMGPIMYVAAGVVVGDSLQGILGGIIRGSGRQSGGAAANFVSFLVFGIPVGTVLVFVAHLGIFGFWLGLLTGEVVQTLIYCILVLTIRWKKQAAKAQERAIGGPTVDMVANEKLPLLKGQNSSADYTSGKGHSASLRTDVGQGSLLVNESTNERSPQPVKIGCATVVVRVLTCAVFVLVLIGGVALSQLCVYRCDPITGNFTNSSVNSSFLFDTWSIELNATYSCTWHFLEAVHKQ